MASHGACEVISRKAAKAPGNDKIGLVFPLFFAALREAVFD
jgi:hypothetical protein